MSTVLLLAGCQYFDKGGPQADAVARVGKMYLYHANLQGLVPEGSSAEDSLERTNAYIDTWIRQHLIILEAEEQLRPEQKDFREKLEDYRLSLLRYRFETEVLAPKMDTTIDKEVIKTYYNANKEQFELRRALMKGRFVKVELKAPKQEQLKRLMLAKRNKDIEALADYCFQYAFSFQLPDTNWVYVDEVMRGVESDLIQGFNFKNYDQVQSVEDSLYRYYLVCKEYRGIGDQSPLSFELYNIRSLILLQRRQEFIERYYEERYRKAQEEKKIEIYALTR
ncbi:MAG: hypothetical protein Q8J69_00245 [Sphingobacteriaceae bacterium]|nr:hypothetical protein [Sphingobacteriaceae bacterium]